jgi:hypothetical protein
MEPPLGDYTIALQYLLLNEKAYSKEQLLTVRNIVSTLFLAEGHYDIALLEQELLNLYDREADKQAVSLFLNWFRQLALYGKVSPEDYEKLDVVYRTKEEVQTMLVTALAQERKKIYQQGKDDGVAEGKAAGVAEGKAAGVAEGQRQTLLQLLQHRFQLNEAEVAQIAEQLAQITEAQALTALTNQGLQAATVAEFKSALYNYLSAENRA